MKMYTASQYISIKSVMPTVTSSGDARVVTSTVAVAGVSSVRQVEVAEVIEHLHKGHVTSHHTTSRLMTLMNS